jgi:hypothetical protein
MGGKIVQKKKVIADIIDLLPKLDEEGLTFLLEQTRIHLYNMEVERQERDTAMAATKAAGSVSKKRPTASKGGVDISGFRIERADDGETYHLVSGGLWKMFTAAEMASMVNIVRGEGDEGEIGRRLHSWLFRERRDVLSDFSLGSEPGPSTSELIRLLRKTFSGKRK